MLKSKPAQQQEPITLGYNSQQVKTDSSDWLRGRYWMEDGWNRAVMVKLRVYARKMSFRVS